MATTGRGREDVRSAGVAARHLPPRGSRELKLSDRGARCLGRCHGYHFPRAGNCCMHARPPSGSRAPNLPGRGARRSTSVFQPSRQHKYNSIFTVHTRVLSHCNRNTCSNYSCDGLCENKFEITWTPPPPSSWPDSASGDWCSLFFLLPAGMIRLFSLKQQSKEGATQQTTQRSTAAFLRVQKGRC